MTPELWYKDAEAAISWLGRVFGLRERLRRRHPSGALIAAELQLQRGCIAVVSAPPGYRAPIERGQTCGRVIFFVGDVDAHYARVRRQGGHIVFAPEDKPWGLRRYEVLDVEGHSWQFNQHLRDVPPAAWGAIAAGARGRS